MIKLVINVFFIILLGVLWVFMGIGQSLIMSSIDSCDIFFIFVVGTSSHFLFTSEKNLGSKPYVDQTFICVWYKFNLHYVSINIESRNDCYDMKQLVLFKNILSIKCFPTICSSFKGQTECYHNCLVLFGGKLLLRFFE